MVMNDNNYVIFKVNDLYCALSCLEVQEIIRDTDHITPIPQADESISGVINIRGKIVSVLNLPTHFKLDFNKADSDSIIVVNDEDECVGLYVSEVIDVIDLSGTEIEHTPAVPHKLDPHYVKGVMEFNKEITAVLNLKEILNVESAESEL